MTVALENWEEKALKLSIGILVSLNFFNLSTITYYIESCLKKKHIWISNLIQIP